MTVEEQLAVIRNASFEQAMHSAVTKVTSGLTSLNAVWNGTVEVQVESIPVVIEMTPDDLKIGAGKADSDQPLFTWTLPKAWFTA